MSWHGIGMSLFGVGGPNIENVIYKPPVIYPKLPTWEQLPHATEASA